MKRSIAVLAAGAALAGGLPSRAQEFPATPPALPPAPAARAPAPVTRALPNGMKVMYVRMPELPVVHSTLVVLGAGSTDDPAALPGLASFTAGMLDEGAGGKSALELAGALDMLGANLFTGAGWDAAQVDLYVLRRNLPDALQLMADVVVRPDFPAHEVQRVRDERITALLRGKDEPTVIAGNAFQALVFGPQHPYGRFATVEATRGLERDPVAAFHAAAYRPDRATLILTGDVEPGAVHPLVERAFGGWRARGPAPRPGGALAVPEIGSTTIYLIDRPGAAQSEIRIGHPGVARDNPDYFPLQVLNTVLGGAFTSRLNTNLRETHGWTYGARSGFQMRKAAGPFTAQAGVQTAATDSALVEFFKELNRIRSEPVPAEELEKAKKYVALGFPRSFETTSAVAGQLANLVTYGIDPSFFDTFVQRVMAVTADDVRRVANRYVRPGASVVVVVGDRQAIEAAVRAANLGPVEIREVTEFVR